MSNKGFTGKVLWIDLSNKRYWEEEIPERLYELLIGGKGLGAWLLLNNLPVGTPPLSAENILMFMTGPLTGTFAPTSSRFAVITKSPKTGTFLDSYCGGFFGQAIKFMGYDGIILCKTSSKLVVVVIDKGKVDFLDGEDLKGATTFETDDYLRNLLGKDWRWVVIGPAGERKSPLAGVFSEGRCAGRGGAGAVMGSKNVKAIAIKNKGCVEVAKPVEFIRACKEAYRSIRMSSAVRKLNREGTPKMVEPLSRMGGIGTNNFQSDTPKFPEVIFPEKWWSEIWVKNGACFACPIGCSKYFEYKSGGVSRLVDGPDFETIFAIGTNCGIYDKGTIARCSAMCDEYGIDTISVGGIIAFLMELNQRGFLGKNNIIGNLKPEWGSERDVLLLIKQIGEGGLTDIEKGVKYLSEIFPGSESFAMHVKGMEFPAYHPWKAPGVGLAYAVSDRGACHLRGAPVMELLGLETSGKPEEEAELVVMCQDSMAAMDCLIVCVFVQYGIGLDHLSRIIEACMGFDLRGAEGLEIIGRRAWVLSKLFNIREGIGSEQDVLPDRCLIRNDKGELNLEDMKRFYYRFLGFTENGYPKKQLLEKLGLDSIIEYSKIGIEILD